MKIARFVASNGWIQLLSDRCSHVDFLDASVLPNAPRVSLGALGLLIAWERPFFWDSVVLIKSLKFNEIAL
jgi:hypothetical protein